MSEKRKRGYKLWLDCEEEDIPHSSISNYRNKFQKMDATNNSKLMDLIEEPNEEIEIITHNCQLLDVDARNFHDDDDKTDSESENEESMDDEIENDDEDNNAHNDVPTEPEDKNNENRELVRKLQSPEILNVITIPVVVSEGELLSMFLKFAISAELTHTAVTQLFKAVNCMFASNVLPDTSYFIDKLFFSTEFVKYHCICPHCDSYVDTFIRTDKEKECTVCQEKFSVNGKNYNSFFVTCDIKNNIKTLLESHENYYNHVMKNRIHEEGVYRDIYDGNEYRKFVDSLPPDEKESYVTFTFNCDGAPTFESSTFSIYPIQLIMNELPVEVRTKETIVCALWFGKSKPDMNVLLKGYVDYMNDLSESGVSCTIKGEKKLVKPYAICCSVDAVARAPMQGIKQFNGSYSCPWCLHPGEYIRNVSNTGGCIKFPIMEKTPNKRTEQHFLNCLNFISNLDSLTDIDQDQSRQNVNLENIIEANEILLEVGDECEDTSNSTEKNEERAFGVKHVSPLNNLKRFKMIDGFVQEDMHFARLGIARQFAEYWINGKTSPLSKTLSSEDVKSIDQLLNSISVPHQTMRLTRSLSDREHWKAKEWENWILYYSLPILELYLEKKLFRHWALFVEAFYLSLQTVIIRTDLERIDSLMKQFALYTEKWYSKSAMTSNLHAGIHWAEGLKNWGPSWAHNAFPFESGNGKLLRMIKAANGVTHQICRKISMHQCDLLLSNHILPESSPRVQIYCSSLQSKTTQKTCKINSGRYFGTAKIPKAKWVQKLQLSPQALSYKKLVKDKCLYSSNVSERSNNSYAETSNGSFVKIIEFIVEENLEKEYAVIKYLFTENAYSNRYPFLQSVITLEKTIEAISVDDLKTISVFLKINDKEYICSVPNLYYY